MRVLVCGGRDFGDTAFIFTELDRLHARHRFTVLIEGVARGVDTIAGEWARSRGVALVECPADWDGLGRKAGPLRNEQMLREGGPDLVIAFPGKRGTAHMCMLATDAGVPLIRIDPLRLDRRHRNKTARGLVCPLFVPISPQAELRCRARSNDGGFFG